MTRHGTLAYYLAAWVIGCFIVSLLAWGWAARNESSASVSMLLILYFVALAYGAADVLLFAFLLRRLMRFWGTHGIWIWMLAGAGLATGLLWLLLWSGDALTRVSPLSGRGPIAYLLLVFWTAPNALRLAGVWQAPIGGAVTAVVLCLVDRAFNRPNEASDARHSQAPLRP
jgi:hypothetical protein